MQSKSYIEILPAKHGDAFIIHSFRGEEENIIVVDGGPKGTQQVIYKRLKELPRIDLMILTHYDEDHIYGLLHYMKKMRDTRPFPVRIIWVNHACNAGIQTGLNISYGQARKLSELLTEMGNNAPEWCVNIMAESKYSMPCATLHVISPTQGDLQANWDAYEKEVGGGVNLAASQRLKAVDLDTPLVTLATRPFIGQREGSEETIANDASIAFIMECDDLRLLMLGDSNPVKTEAYLREMGYQEGNKLEVDYVKISHHGSKYSTNNGLLDIVQCDNFIISTNGGHSNSYHPDRVALARIICHPARDYSRQIKLFFSHPIEEIEHRTGTLFMENESADYNFVIEPFIQILP